ncbi:MAG: DUF1330 domain-containing protein [Pseudomonadota bacterium]
MSKPVYSFGYIQVKDHAEYMERYGQHIPAIIAAFGGEFLAATKSAVLVEGTAPGNWVVLSRFPSMEKAKAFMESDAYAPFRAMRRDALTDSNLIISFADELPGLG